MRTVECLRGRLLAERVASKAAKEEADQLAKRLDELEKKLADEVKVRNKAERRLRRAIKKLESLKIGRGALGRLHQLAVLLQWPLRSPGAGGGGEEQPWLVDH